MQLKSYTNKNKKETTQEESQIKTNTEFEINKFEK